MKRRTVTTIESHEVVFVRGLECSRAPKCHICVDSMRMLKPSEAAPLAGVSERTLYRWLEEGRLHFIETREGGLFVCLGPLATGKNY